MVFEHNGETTMLPPVPAKEKSRISALDVVVAATKLFLRLV
jgi:hypothetical protein